MLKKPKTKKKRGKSRPSAPASINFPTQYFSKESDPQVDPEVDSTGGYSPMDYSPCCKELLVNQCSRETSVASKDSFHFFSCGASTDTPKAASGEEQEEVLMSEAHRLNIGEVGDNGEDVVKRNSKDEPVFLDEQTDKFGNDSDISKHDNRDLHNGVTASPADAEAGFVSSNLGRPASESETEFTFSSSLGDLGESNFKFTASPSVQRQSSAVKHTYRRKNRLKSGQNPSLSATNATISITSPLLGLIQRISTSHIPDSLEGQTGTSSSPRSKDEWKTGKCKELDARQQSTSSASASVAAQELCEKWRFRGNQAYANGHLTKAEDYYTRGVNSLSLKEIPSGCIKPLSLFYSSHAATRMSLGKWREALNDCKMAVSLDPNFLKAQVRVASCHLALGEIGEALNQYKKCLQSEKNICSDQKYIIEASDGLQKAQSAGNEAFQAARHSEAVEYYSSALACNVESRPFVAVCFCNCAAAYQTLGQVSDAIADCSLAIALDPSYAKAISRRATLHEMIRDYGQAAHDLNRLISLLQKQMQEKDNESIGVVRPSPNVTDLKQARSRLATVEGEARKGLSLNMYMILAIEPSSCAADVKKAYRKAAPRHHPDKAGQFLARNENVDDELWKEVAAEVRADADRLFKMIGRSLHHTVRPYKASAI